MTLFPDDDLLVVLTPLATIQESFSMPCFTDSILATAMPLPVLIHAEQVVVLEISKAGRRQQHSRPQAAQAERASLGFKGEKRLYNSHASPLRHHPSQTQLVRLANQATYVSAGALHPLYVGVRRKM